MNFLAHLYLSGNDDLSRVGNFIGDYVKGNSWEHYPDRIARGIKIHRFIDSYTDKHEAGAQSRALFRNEYSKYAGVVVDVVYDYLLCQRWATYSTDSLQQFAHKCYTLLCVNYSILPIAVQRFLPTLIARNRLMRYATMYGVEEALHTMSCYTSLPDHSEQAGRILSTNEAVLQSHFDVLMPDLIHELRVQFPDSNFCRTP